MKCVLLVAGFATRLYPLTKDVPKSLLEVGGSTILERILKKVERVGDLDEVILVSNHRFFNQFISVCELLNDRNTNLRYRVLDDGSTDNENRLGAVADLAFAVKARVLTDDLMVLAGDNLFDFELTDFVSFYLTVNSDCITAHRLDDVNQLRRTGVVELDEHHRVLSFQEKPAEPASTWAVPPFYLYKAETLPLLELYLNEGGDSDAPGNFIPWLIRRRPVNAYVFAGTRYDIGTIESLREVQKLFSAAISEY